MISARRGGAAVDAVVGAGEPIGRQSPLGVAVAASGAHAEKRVAGCGNGPRNRGRERVDADTRQVAQNGCRIATRKSLGFSSRFWAHTDALSFERRNISPTVVNLLDLHLSIPN